MKISIITVGILKEKYLKQGHCDYLKRLSAYPSVDIIEFANEKLTGNYEWCSDAEKMDELAMYGKSKVALSLVDHWN